MGALPEWTAAKKKLFLHHFAQIGVISAAATMAGLHRNTVYLWESSDEQFKADLAMAKLEAYDVLLLEARRRAVEGNREPIVSGGKIVGSKFTYSDDLLKFLMRSWRPELHTDKWEGKLDTRQDLAIHYHIPEGALVDGNGEDVDNSTGGRDSPGDSRGE